MGLSFDERLKNLTDTLGTEEEIKRMRQLINQHRWVFAKTYADFCPHEYSLRSEWRKDEFKEFVHHILKYGMDACYGKQSPKTYWFDQSDGYYYFLSKEDTDKEGNVTDVCMLINRGNLKYFDFWIEEDLIGRIVRCKVKPGGAKMAQEDREPKPKWI